MTPLTDRERAITLAHRMLERPHADPDDDLAILSRQVIRMNEAYRALVERVQEVENRCEFLTDQRDQQIASSDEFIHALQREVERLVQERDELKGVVLSVCHSRMGIATIRALDELRKVGKKYASE